MDNEHFSVIPSKDVPAGQVHWAWLLEEPDYESAWEAARKLGEEAARRRHEEITRIFVEGES